MGKQFLFVRSILAFPGLAASLAICIYFCLPSPPRKQNECLTEKKQQEITRVLQIFKLALVCLQRTTHTRHRSIQQQQHLTAYERSGATMQKINYVKI